MQYLSGCLEGAIRKYRELENRIGVFKFIPRIIAIASAAAIAILSIGMAWQSISEKADQRKYANPPGILVDIGGYRLHMLQTGRDPANWKGPVIVLEAGLGCNHQDWTKVQRELSKDGKAVVISYDRAGYGWSDRSPLPRTSGNEVEELKTLLEKSGYGENKLILVGHSFGGINARLFAHRYREKVAALVLVESCHEEQNARQPEDPPEGLDRFHAWGNPEWAQVLTRIGATRFFLPRSELPSDLETSFSKDIRDSYLASVQSAKFAEVIHEETKLFDQSGEELKAAKGHLGNRPVVVLTAGESHAKDPVWDAMQEEMVQESDLGLRLYTETEYDHMIPWHEPEQVVQAIRKADAMLPKQFSLMFAVEPTQGKRREQGS